MVGLPIHVGQLQEDGRVSLTYVSDMCMFSFENMLPRCAWHHPLHPRGLKHQ